MSALLSLILTQSSRPNRLWGNLGGVEYVWAKSPFRVLLPLLVMVLASGGAKARIDQFAPGDSVRIKAAIQSPNASAKAWVVYHNYCHAMRDVELPTYEGFIDRGLALAKAQGRLKPYHRLMTLQMLDHFRYGRDSLAQANLKVLLSFADIQKDDTLRAMCLITKGAILARSTSYTEGLKYILEGLTLSQKLHLERLELIYRAARALIYGYGGTYKATLALYYEAVSFGKRIGDTMNVAHLYNNIANIHSNAKAYDSAIYNLNLAIKDAKRYQAPHFLYTCQVSLAETYKSAGMHDKALELCRQIENSSPSKSGKIDAEVWLVMLESLTKLKRYEEASRMGLKIIQEYRKLGWKSDLNHIWGQYAMALLNSGHHEMAAVALDSHFYYGGQFHDDKLTQQLNEIQSQYTNRERALTIAKLETDKANQAKVTYLLLVVLALVIVILIISIFTTRKLSKRRQELQIKTEIIEAQNQQLAAINNSKDRIMGIIAHDLRGPLGTLASVSTMGKALVESHDYDMLKQLFGHLSNTTQSVNDLLNNLLSWAVSQKGNLSVQPEQLIVLQVWQKVEQLFADQADRKGIMLKSQIEPDATVWADYNSLFTILRNVVGNALKFTPMGGEIQIISYNGADRLGTTIISVQDNGRGMTQEQLQALNNTTGVKFSVGTAGEKGAGLGILIIKELLALNGGSILVESGPKVGTRIQVTLPAAQVGNATNPDLVGKLEVLYVGE